MATCNLVSSWLNALRLTAANFRSCGDAAVPCMQGICEINAAFVASAVTKCQHAVEAVDSAHEALVASGEEQARQLESSIVAQHAATQRALLAAQDNAAATIRSA